MVDHEAVKTDAKRIMDEFIKELGDVHIDQIGMVREHMIRSKTAPDSLVEGFTARMLENAPLVKDQQVQMEKKHWGI